MRKYSFSLFLAIFIILFSALSFPQIVDHPPFWMYQEIPQFENHGLGIGNSGFDSPLNIYNPHYIPRDTSSFKISIGADIGLPGAHYLNFYEKYIDKIYRNPKTLVPSLGLQYWYKDYLFQLNYYKDYSMYADDNSSHTAYGFSTPYGTYQVSSHEREINISSNTLQLSINYSPIPQISYTIGILSRRFRYEWDIKYIPSVVNQNSLLDNFQFLAGITAKPVKSFQTYFTVMSQRPRVNLSDAVYKLNSITIVYPGSTKVSYYGIIGYGFQANIIDQLKVSVEMRHQFLEDTTYVLNSKGYMSLENGHIWNNEMTLGVTLSLLDMLQLGYRYSYFLKYDNYKGFTYAADNPYLDVGRISHPASFAVTGSVNINRFNILLMYQYSSAYYQLLDPDINYSYEDKTYLLSLLVGYSFSL